MSKEDIEENLKILKIINHPIRAKIIILLKNNICNISELQKKIGVKYKSTWHHVRTLESYGIVKTKQKINKVGKIVEVKLLKFI